MPVRNSSTGRARSRWERSHRPGSTSSTSSCAFGSCFDAGRRGYRRLERLLIRRGTRLHAQVKPYVVETAEGPVEVADLFFADGTATRAVRFERFRFVD